MCFMTHRLLKPWHQLGEQISLQPFESRLLFIGFSLTGSVINASQLNCEFTMKVNSICQYKPYKAGLLLFIGWGTQGWDVVTCWAKLNSG